MTDEQFDQLLKAVREEPVSPEQIASATERVWQRLQGAPACAGFRPDQEAYVTGALPEQRRMLFEDHLSRCAPCRHSLAELKGEVTSIARPVRRAPSQWPRWAAAAGILLGGLYLGSDRIDAALAPSGPRATVVSLSGDLYRWPQGTLKAGASIGEGEAIQTGSGARAVLRLADGSRVEMNQRTELIVTAAWSGQTLRLSRGDVMVEAAKQRRGRLRVVTHDSTASVKGTVFEVSSGTAGSAVSVVEGSVAVSQPGSQRLLTKGQTTATNQALETNVRQAVGWSQDSEKYLTLLGEIAGLEKQITETASVRTQPRLLKYLPEGVQVYVAIPNLTGSIRQALFQFEQRTRENAVLKEWWDSAEGNQVRTTLDRIQSVTPLLGEETVFALVRDRSQPGGMYSLVLSEVQASRQSSLQDALSRIAGSGKTPYKIINNLMVISDDAAALDRLNGRISAPFAAEIGRRYQMGTGWLAAVDMSQMPGDFRESKGAKAAGLSNARYLFFEQGAGGRSEDNQVTLSFTGARSGVASWLAPAGAAGSTEYVSPDAVAVFSAATKDPRQAFEELLATLGTDVAGDLQKFESETGVSVSADIAASFGTDFTVAVERPTIPIPGWAAALEVVRPGVLDSTIQRLVDQANQRLTGDAVAQKLTWKQESVSGRTWTSLSSTSGISVFWTYDRGYMVVSMDRALAARAITIRDSGSSLVHSATFRDRFPPSGGLYQSGFVWINAAATGLAGLVSDPTLKNLLSNREPILIILDGGAEQIHAASRTRLTSMILDLMLATRPGVPPSVDRVENIKEKQLIPLTR